MNITTKLDNISDNLISDYLKSLGITNIKRFLKPTKTCFEDPWNYPNMANACEILNFYVENKENIGIVMDSDMDGACSAALIYNFLIYLGVNKDLIHVYHHEGKQHGIKDLVDKIILNNGKNSLLIVPDAGTNDRDSCLALSDATINVLVCDHHIIENNNIFATVVNNQCDEITNHALSGTGVTDKFVRAYCDTFKIDYPNYSDLVAVSLVADVCDISVLENRAYIYHGLKNLTNPFLKFLFEKLCKYRGLTPSAIGWDIAPLANALARSDVQESKTLFFDGLVGNINPEQTLKQMRKIKREQDAKIKDVVGEIEPNLALDKKVIFGYTQPENASFTGLIANKILGKYGKPTILLRDTGYGSWSGSLRSPTPLATQINENGIASAQGHEEACGILVKKNKLAKFAEWLETLDLSVNPDIEVVAIVDPKDITLDLCQMVTDYNQLWGHGLEQPTFYIKTRITQDNVFVFEKSMKTLKLDLGGLNCLKFFASDDDVTRFRKYKEFEVELVVGDLSVNEYEGVKTPQCIIQKYEVHEINEDWNDCF